MIAVLEGADFSAGPNWKFFLFREYLEGTGGADFFSFSLLLKHSNLQLYKQWSNDP